MSIRWTSGEPRSDTRCGMKIACARPPATTSIQPPSLSIGRCSEALTSIQSLSSCAANFGPRPHVQSSPLRAQVREHLAETILGLTSEEQALQSTPSKFHHKTQVHAIHHYNNLECTGHRTIVIRFTPPFSPSELTKLNCPSLMYGICHNLKIPTSAYSLPSIT